MPGLIQKLVVESDGEQALAGIMQACFVSNHRVTHVAIHPDSTSLTLQWSLGRDSVALPFPLTSAEEVATYVTMWLSRSAKYPRDIPDTDGSVNKGFRITVPQGDFYAVAKVEPCWIVYGK